MEKRFTMIPVHLDEAHWMLLSCKPKGTDDLEISMVDSMESESLKRLTERIEESFQIFKTNTRSISKLSIRIEPSIQQTNGHSCGDYLICNLFCAAFGYGHIIAQNSMLRAKLAETFSAEDV